MDHFLNDTFISTREASIIFGYTSDYLARLARTGKIHGKRIGHSWVIDRHSLQDFLALQAKQKIDSARTLSREREGEYHAHNSPVRRVMRLCSKEHIDPNIDLVSSSLRSEILALSVATFMLVCGTLSVRVFDVPQSAGQVASLAREVAEGFDTAFGEMPSRVALKITNAHRRLHSETPLTVLEPLRRTYDEASAHLSTLNPSILQRAVFITTYTPDRDKLSIAHAYRTLIAPTTTIDTATEFFNSTYASFTNVKLHTVGDTYALFGIEVYDSILTLFDGYRSLVGRLGESTLLFATATRDALVASPVLITEMNLALGYSIIGASHAVIHADVDLMYTIAILAPKTAQVTVALLGTIGDSLARTTAQMPAYVTRQFLFATALPSTLGPLIAERVFRTEYASADYFIEATNTLSKLYLLQIQNLGGLTYAGITLTISLITDTTSALVRAPAYFEDAYLGILGKSALALESVASLPRIAAAVVAGVPALSTGEQFALATYQTFHSLITSTKQVFATLFGSTTQMAPTKTHSLVQRAAPTPAPVTPVVAATSSAPIRTTLNSYPTFTTIVRGVTQDSVNQSLASLRAEVLATVAGMIQPVAAQTATNVTTIQQVNMIQDLSNLIVRNGSFRGGTFDGGAVTNASTVSAIDGSFTNLLVNGVPISNSGAWGTISGTLSSQADLQDALNAKLSLAAWYATTTDALAEGLVNKYWSNTLFDTRLSATTSLPNLTTLANLAYATTSNLNITNTITGAGLVACAGSTNKLLWDSATQKFTCGVDAGSSGGLTGLGAQYSSYQTGSTQTFATSSDTNIGLTITSSGDTHTFTPTWIGTLGDSRIASAATWNAKQTSALAKGNFLVGDDAGVAQATSSIFVSSTGRIGIGTASPLARLDIVNGSGALSQLRLSDTISDATNKYAYFTQRHYTNAEEDTSLVIGSNSSTINSIRIGGGSGSFNAATQLDFYTATSTAVLTGTQRLTINNLGSVGIGSTTPSSVLSITNTVGTVANTPLFTIASTTGGTSTTTLMTVLANGNVGIGTTTPAYKLDVNGFINTDQFSGYKQAGNTILWATTSTSSFFAGPFAGNGSLATTTAFGNVGIGAYALYLATSTGFNTAVGYSALRNVSAGPNTWNGTYNTAIGYNTGANITTGFENTLVGYNAGSSITTGAALTFIGHNVGALNTTGLNNVAMGTLSTGRGALYSNTIGSNSTAIGSGALYFNTNSNNNTALGAYAGNGNANYSNTGGVYIGTLAGAQLGTGSNYNTLIGFNAGDAITTGFGNILIGAGVSATSSTATNSLNIGNVLFGTGLYSGSATSSTPTANGMLGIGTTSPFATLSVAGNGFFNSSLTASNITATGTLSVLGNTTLGTLSGLIAGNNGLLYQVASSSLFGFTPVSNALAKGNFLVGDDAGVAQATSSIYVSSVGSVGIGSTTPWGLLSLNPNNITGPAFAIGSSSATSLVVTNGGLVGVGTSSPTQKLTVVGDTNGLAIGPLLVKANGLTSNVGAALTVDATVFSGGHSWSFISTGTTATPGAGKFGFYDSTATSYRMLIDTTGNIGIGTIAPASRLDVQNSATSSAIASFRDPLGNVSLEFRASTSTLNNTYIGLGTGAVNTTGQNNTALGYQNLFSNTTGQQNVALGYQTLYTNAGGTSNTATGYQSLYNNDTGSYNIANGYKALYGTTAGFNNVALGYQSLYNLSSGYDNIMIGTQANTGGNSITTGRNNIMLGFNAGIGTSTNSTNFLNIGNSFFGTMVATSSSTSLPTDYSQVSFGVGSSSPWAMLSVNPTVGMTGPAFAIGSSTATNFVVSNAGKVGVGTTSPYRNLSVSGTSMFAGATDVLGQLRVATSTTFFRVSNTNPLEIDTQDPTVGMKISNIGGNDGYTTLTPNGIVIAPNTAGTGRFVVYNDNNYGNEAFSIDTSAGSHGVGTTTVFGALIVDNSFGEKQRAMFRVTDGGSGSILQVDNLASGGYVGIGTTSPFATLSVAGSGFFNSSLTASNLTATGTLSVLGNTTLGTLSGLIAGNNGLLYQVASSSLFGFTPVSNALAKGNFLVGDDAGVAQATSSIYVSSVGSIGIGTTSPAARLDITNIATSSSALTLRDSTGAVALEIRASTSTLQNTYLGQDTGLLTTTGSNNTAVGYQNLYSNVNGLQNTALGYQTLYTNTNGTSNTATGFKAMYTTLSGGSNTAAGYSALYTNSTGSNNTATGYQTLYNSTASNNTATGYKTLFGNSTGVFNVGMGYQAGYNVTSGYDNVMIGHIQNTGGSNITTGYNNILLGYNAGLGTTTSSSNFLNIGNSFFGTMTATSSSTSLPTDYSQVSFGIGSSSPWAMLSVNPTVGMTGPAFAIGSSTATNFVVSNAGKVGVGTTTPTYKLDVYGATSTDAINTNVGLNFTQVPTPTSGSLALTTGGSVDAGLHYYLVTFYTAMGETNIYLIGSITTDAVNNAVTVTIPVSTDPRVIGRKIYRTKVGGGYWQDYIIPTGTITNNTATTYTDTTADVSLTGSIGSAYYRSNTTNRFVTLNGTPAMLADVNETNFGVGAGASTTNGGQNSLFGYKAGGFITSGIQNVAVGHTAGYNITSGQTNIAIGWQALFSTNAGTQNIGIGRGAGQTNTTGNDNVAVGTYAMYGSGGNNSTANTALGTNSLFSLTTGAYNVGLGFDAGYGLTTGSRNIFLGVSTLANSQNQVTTGSSNISIGDNVSIASSTLSNQLTIGNLLFGTGLSGTAKTISPGKIGIGTTSPFALFSVVNATTTPANTPLFTIASTTGNTATSTFMMVLANGNVGIGTTSPGSLLSLGGANTGVNFFDGTSATSTISGNLHVKGTLRSTVSYVGDLVFSNNFRFVEGDANISPQTLNLNNQFGSTTLTVADTGNIGIGTVATNAKLTISGNVSAGAYETAHIPATSFTFASTTVTAEIPLTVLTVAGDVDLYKLATYTLSGITALSDRVSAEEVRLTALENRMSALESGAVSSASGSPFTLSTSTLASTLTGFGVLIEKSITQFSTLVADRFVAATNSEGTASASTGIILVNNTVVQVTNAYVKPTTKVFVTFNAQVVGSWWVADKVEGSFKVVLSAPQTTDVSFDYFLVQTEGQLATTTPETITPPASGSTPPAVANPPMPSPVPPDPLPPMSPTASSTPPVVSSDATPPIVTLNGAAAMELNIGDSFTDPGASATDDTDGDVTTKIIETGMVDTGTAGIYTLTYSVTDSSGNTGVASRLVSVVAPPPTP